MSFETEAVTLSGSGLTFINYYDASVTAAYRSAIIAAEHELQSHFTNQVTIGVNFALAPLSANSAATNGFNTLTFSYANLAAALRTHAASSDDALAVNGLPSVDPSGGAGFAIPVTQARILGLAAQANSDDVDVTLNSNLTWSFGQDAIGAIEHEITEGGFGRVASLGLQGSHWQALDLFRFTAAGVRDYTGGSDGQATYFGIDASHVFTALPYHSAFASGTDDGADLGDWEHKFLNGATPVRGDAFGSGGPNAPGSISATDLRVLDVIGWNSTPFTPAADDYANSQADAAHAIGQLFPGGAAISASLQQAGDRDWFAVQFQAGATYTISEQGWKAGAGTLADPYLRLHDSSGAEVAFNDDVISGTNPDALITFTAPTSGTYYVEAGAFVDGYAGSYRLSVSGASSDQPTAGPDALTASASQTQIDGGAGDDTISGWSGGDSLFGGDGNDIINGGSGFDRTNGNAGNDTVHGNAGDDWVTGGKDNDALFGDAGNDILNGNLGNDTESGGLGNDTVRGGQGDDVLYGGDGADYITGDLGNDTMTGGAGADTFRAFNGEGADVITDFTASEGDRVQLDPGTTYTTAQVGADTVITLGGGASLTLQGVTLADLPSGWIFGA
ncbi:NF038122 family metalloprotease [Phenylobacterium soli]|uniref:Peptidase C-terminal archaeal/bacterial domain-containing protein n=1 Tax=Phenylobacterium soli TaxID=2170551 RepID=A0A328AFR4_9CAUL|nr:NF038122 family metalloprotease [Phenylobacterium soli]RAK53367.1 hypothetical protein DJ017_01895 [Phenylobacterium soli]